MVAGSRGSAQSTGFGKPILWFTEYNPWAMFIGADGPTFTVYESGKVIYWKYKTYHQVTLSASDLQELLSGCNFSDTFFARTRRISASDWTDQPTYVLCTNLDTLKKFSVYGSMRDADTRSRVPGPWKAIYDRIASFDDDEAVDWLPDKIEVMLSVYDNSRETPIPWPAGWPDLNSLGSRRWADGGGNIFLDKRELARLRKLLGSRKETQAFRIGGKDYSAEYRLVVPGVDSVMAACRRGHQQ